MHKRGYLGVPKIWGTGAPPPEIGKRRFACRHASSPTWVNYRAKFGRSTSKDRPTERTWGSINISAGSPRSIWNCSTQHAAPSITYTPVGMLNLIACWSNSTKVCRRPAFHGKVKVIVSDAHRSGSPIPVSDPYRTLGEYIGI